MSGELHDQNIRTRLRRVDFFGLFSGLKISSLGTRSSAHRRLLENGGQPLFVDLRALSLKLKCRQILRVPRANAFWALPLKNATKKHKDVRLGSHCAPNVPHIFQYILAPDIYTDALT